MKVKELIKELQQEDQESDLRWSYTDAEITGTYFDVDKNVVYVTSY